MTDDESSVVDALWRMYGEHCTHVRHHETQRSSVAAAFIAIAGALVGLITYDKELTVGDLPGTIFLLGVGIFGALFCAKQWERACKHTQRARHYRNKIDQLLTGVDIKSLKQKADEVHDREFPRLHKLRLHKFWIGLYLLIALLGFVLSIIAWMFPVVDISRNNSVPTSIAPRSKAPTSSSPRSSNPSDSPSLNSSA
jgi:hypothetical protein